MPNTPYRRFVLDASFAGLTVHEACLAAGLVEPEEWFLRLHHGGVWRDKWRVEDGEEIIEDGAVLTVHLPPGGAYPEVQVTSEQIIWEDDVLLVLNKQPGVYVHAAPWDTHGNVLAALGRFIEIRDGRTYPLHLAHQLDRDTSGVLVVTKDPRANAPLQQAFSQRHVQKSYVALATGQPEADRWTIETGHGRGAHGLFRIYPLEQVGQPLPVGNHKVKYMATEFEVRQRFGAATLLEARPKTGRTHQIRLHLHAQGHPILGVARYGGPLIIGDLPLGHHLLHARRLGLRHPLSRAQLELTAPIPTLFEQVLAVLQGS